MTQTLLGLGKLFQAVQPEVEMLRRHSGAQALVQFTGELMATLEIDDNLLINETDPVRPQQGQPG